MLCKNRMLAAELYRKKEELEDVKKSVDVKLAQKTQDFQKIISALEQKVKNRTHEYEQLLDELEKIKKIKEPTKRARASRSTNNR